MLGVAAVEQNGVRQLVPQDALDPAVVGEVRVVHLPRDGDAEGPAFAVVLTEGEGTGARLPVPLSGGFVDLDGAGERGVLLLHEGEERVEARLHPWGHPCASSTGAAVVVCVFAQMVEHDPSEGVEVGGWGLFPLDGEAP